MIIRLKDACVRRAAEELKKALAGIPPSPPAGNEKDFPSAADRLDSLRISYGVPEEMPRQSKDDMLTFRESGAAPRYERQISYSLPLPPEAEKQLMEETELREATFSRRLSRLLAQRRIRPPAFYKAAGIDRKLFSAISRDESYQPSRETAIRCCLALHLGPEDTEEMLRSAGYALSGARRFDLIIRWCIENGIWDLGRVNTLLDELGETPFR